VPDSNRLNGFHDCNLVFLYSAGGTW
jgi:hypothetical protein